MDIDKLLQALASKLADKQHGGKLKLFALVRKCGDHAHIVESMDVSTGRSIALVDESELSLAVNPLMNSVLAQAKAAGIQMKVVEMEVIRDVTPWSTVKGNYESEPKPEPKRPVKCPICEHIHDAANEDNEPLEHGAKVVCTGCASLLIFEIDGEKMSMRKVTTEEFVDLSAEDRSALRKMVMQAQAIITARQGLSDKKMAPGSDAVH